jgi:sulfate transport system permease protein
VHHHLLVLLQVLLLSLLDLPFSISPVVTGLMLMLLYGRAGWFATALADSGLKVVFAFTGGSRAALFTQPSLTHV